MDQPRAAGNGWRFAIHRELDRRVLFDLLVEDRSYSVFAIGHLEDDLFERASFWVGRGEDGSAAVVMHASGGLGRNTIVVGEPAGVDAILSIHPGYRGSYLATGAPEHLPVLERTYAVSAPLAMTRMAVTEATFRGQDGFVRRLMGSDARSLNALYATGAGPTGYSPAHIERGVYFGAFERSRLVSVAGTHLVAPQVGAAVVGNVYTHPAARGRGLAGRVTSAVTEALFEHGCPYVTLTVNPANTPAIRAYRRLGYEAGSTVIEARLRRRDVLGLGPLARRWLARRRASDGMEVAPGRGSEPAGFSH
jgi:ribosomal protein S18 acetylase RimI-like enzyme